MGQGCSTVGVLKRYCVRWGITPGLARAGAGVLGFAREVPLPPPSTTMGILCLALGLVIGRQGPQRGPRSIQPPPPPAPPCPPCSPTDEPGA